MDASVRWHDKYPATCCGDDLLIRRIVVEVTVHTLSDCDREMEFQLTTEELAPHFEVAYKKAIPVIEIKGFRKGKVPFAMIKKMFGESIEIQAIEVLSNDTFKKTIEERNILPIGTPTMVDMKYKRGEPLAFKVKYEVKPEFEVKDFRGLEVEQFVHHTNENELHDEIKRLQHINATYEEAKKVTGEEFIVTVDGVEFDENGALSNRKQEATRIYMNEPTTEKEIKEALQGAVAGDVREAKFKHDHADHAHSIHLQLTVKKVEKITLPEMNDEFAKEVSNGKFSTADDLKKNISEDLEKLWSERSTRRLESDILKKVVEQYSFTVPESVVNNLLDAYVQDVKEQQPNRVLPKNFNEKQYREMYHANALWEAKWLLVKEQLLKKENLQMTDGDIEKLAETESAKIGIDKERLMNFYKTSETVSERVLFDKLLALIKESATMTVTETDDVSKFS